MSSEQIIEEILPEATIPNLHWAWQLEQVVNYLKMITVGPKPA